MTTPGADVRAAGIVVLAPGRRVLLVHRPKYDDWSFPKGKLERGEHPVAAAVREVAEETGLHARLALPLPGQRYPVSGGRMKQVAYWTGRVVGDDDVSGYRANDEIDQVAWVSHDEAAARLTYRRDRETLAAALGVRRRTRALVVLRHGQARSRRAWRGDDVERPLLVQGQQQAQRLVPLLAAYDVERVVTSGAVRCRQTVDPYVGLAGVAVDVERGLTEEHHSERRVGRIVESLREDETRRGVAVCTHRPVLPEVFDALEVKDPRLEPGEMLVAHLRKGRVLATERHRPR